MSIFTCFQHQLLIFGCVWRPEDKQSYWGPLATDTGVGLEINDDWPAKGMSFYFFCFFSVIMCAHSDPTLIVADVALPLQLGLPKWGKQFLAPSNAEAYI